MKKFLAILLFFIASIGHSQSIGSYKYAIVASKFSAQKSPGQFGLNDLTKLFLQKNGYTAYLESEILPEGVTDESCDKIFVNVEENNNVLTTRLRVVIKDCRNEILFTSEEGTSKTKDNRIAYNEALRKAFKSFDKPEFRHDASQQVIRPGAAFGVSEKPAEGISIGNSGAVKIETNDGLLLSAQPIENGFQLIDTTPKIVMKIYKTSQPDVYMVESGNGMILKKDGKWFHEYYRDNQLVTRQLDIRF